MKKHMLIVGGSSGLGLELARHYVKEQHTVCITGRQNPELAGARFVEFDVGSNTRDLGDSVEQLLSAFSPVNTLIYAAGFCQRGLIDELDDDALQKMNNVGLLAPAMLIQRLKNNLPTPLKLMLITSSSQYTPRKTEPLYCAVKAGLGMLGASLVQDPDLGKVLVAAPSGIDTPFWRHTTDKPDEMLDASWVAEQVVELSSGAFKYRYAKILKNPPRVVIEENLDNNLQPIV